MQWAWGRGPKNNHSLLTSSSHLSLSLTHTHWPHALRCSSNSVNECHYLSETPRGCSSPLWTTLQPPPQPPPSHSPGGNIRAWVETEQSVGQHVPWGWKLEYRSALQGILFITHYWSLTAVTSLCDWWSVCECMYHLHIGSSGLMYMYP